MNQAEFDKKNRYRRKPLELDKITLEEIVIRDLDLNSSNFTKCVFDRCDLQCVDLNNSIFKEVCFIDCSFTDVIMSTIHGYKLEIKDTRLIGLECNLSNLKECDFSGNDFRVANFVYCEIGKTKFKKCKLQAADFHNSDLSECDFRGSQLIGIVLKNTIIDKTRF